MKKSNTDYVYQFIELETLGPITEIQPGETVAHIETWEVYPDLIAAVAATDYRTSRDRSFQCRRTCWIWTSTNLLKEGGTA